MSAEAWAFLKAGLVSAPMVDLVGKGLAILGVFNPFVMVANCLAEGNCSGTNGLAMLPAAKLRVLGVTGAQKVARTLNEQLLFEEAATNAHRIMKGKINDPRYPENIWAKMEWTHKALDGSKTTVHFWQNTQTGAAHGFKIKK